MLEVVRVVFLEVGFEEIVSLVLVYYHKDILGQIPYTSSRGVDLVSLLRLIRFE